MTVSARGYSAETAQVKDLKAKVRRLEEDNAILKAATVNSTGFLRRGTRPPKPLIMGFIDTMRVQGYAVESVCRVLREQVCQIAARTYRVWRQANRRVAVRTVTEVQVVDAVRHIARTIGPDG